MVKCPEMHVPVNFASKSGRLLEKKKLVFFFSFLIFLTHKKNMFKKMHGKMYSMPVKTVKVPEVFLRK